jgi:hypothetical protein
MQDASGAEGAWESWLAEIEWADTEDPEARQKLVAVEEEALPALLRGWLTAGSTLRGHVRYTVTEAGRQALEQEQEPEPERLPAADPEAQGAYYRELNDARTALRTKSPERAGQVGMIPVPLCHAGRPMPLATASTEGGQ